MTADGDQRRPHGPPCPSTILRMVPLPIRCANREETPTAHNPLIVSISRPANPLIPRPFPKNQRHQPSWPGPVSDSCPSRRWGGRRIQRPDVGGLWSSDEARGKDTPGVLAEVDGWPAPARRALPVRAAVSCPPRADGSNVIGGDPVRPEARAASRRARGKRLRGAVPSLPDRDFTGGSEGRPRSGFVETVKQSKHRARPGRPAPSPNFSAETPKGDDARPKSR